MNTSNNIIEAKKITKSFKDGDNFVTILKGIDLQIPQGQFVSIMGRSGAGKSTLLYQLGLLDHPTSGELYIDNADTTKLSSDDRTMFRLNKLGYVFQDYALLPDLTALENVAVPLLMQGLENSKAYAIALESLEKVGLGQRAGNLSNKLSGGEQQRVSIARSIAHKPKILFADEPTANLDSENSKHVIEIFLELHKAGQTIVMVTHEPEYGRLTERTITLADGQIISDVRN